MKEILCESLVVCVVAFGLPQFVNGQLLFSEECFTGGVMAVGINNIGSGIDTVPFHWEDHYTFKKAYVITYRYGRPAPHTMFINGAEVPWGPQNQAGPELPEVNIWVDWFAVHVQTLKYIPDIKNGHLVLNFPGQHFYENDVNWGWWSMYAVIQYDSPEIDIPVCTRIYIADQRQDQPRFYSFQNPPYIENKPVGYSTFHCRLNNILSEKDRITINGITVGDVWGHDIFYSSGTQGHFYYENGGVYGMSNDTANAIMQQYDGLAIINDYLNSAQLEQSLSIYRIVPHPTGGFNPNPAFVITYTPSCTVPESAVEREAVFCRGDTVQLSAQGYDHYAWTPAVGLNDSTLANPLCFADSSRWYRVRMWSDDETVCPQTIPVFVEVEDVPRPENLQVAPSACPLNTGRVTAQHTPGKKPLTYTLEGTSNHTGEFGNLPPGQYDLSITTALGCTWDTTVVLPRKTLQTADFTPNPESGYSPLEVFFENHSTGATGYRWLIDGVPIRNNEHLRYTFPEAGEYEITLLAFYMDSTCADTARYTLVVWPGMEVVLPNIITPNGDGMNDALVARLSGVAHIRWKVFNRWGNKLHGGEASSPGESLELWRPEPDAHPAGTYTVVVTAQGDSGEVRDFVVQVVVKG